MGVIFFGGFDVFFVFLVEFICCYYFFYGNFGGVFIFEGLLLLEVYGIVSYMSDGLLIMWVVELLDLYILYM